ncbi:MAG: glycosyltransferase [Deltaproteobacteria bacterium]|nr:glycosyltransferase [Deltaproteobacteria bacterium]
MRRISIVIPTYNRAAYLKEAIESALAQDYENLEIIVSDNASTDETEAVAQGYKKNDRFKYYRNSANLGMVGNWRKAIFDYSTGDYFLILSDDDYLLDESYISKAAALIDRENEMVIVVAGSYILYEDTGERISFDLPFKETMEGKAIFLNQKREKSKGFTLSNTIFDRNLTIKLDAFTNSYNSSCDMELFWKLCLYGKVGVVNDHVSVYRRHSRNESTSVKGDIKFLVNNNEAYIEPYKLAKNLGSFTAEQLKGWEEKIYVKIYRTLKSACKSQSFDEVLNALREKYPDIVEIVLKKYYFQLLFIKMRHLFT